MGSAPKLPKAGAQPAAPPNLLDPTVMFARLRERNKAMQATGRASTVLTKPVGSSLTTLGSAISAQGAEATRRYF